MKKLLVRTLTGAIYVGLIVASLLWGGLTWFSLLCCLFALAGMWEMIRMFKGETARMTPATLLDLLTGISIVAAMALSGGRPSVLMTVGAEVTFLILLRGVLQLYLHTSSPIKEISTSAMAIGYVALPLATACCMDYFVGPECVLLIFIMIWLNDTCAFLVGSLIGRHKLFERLSPKKSWEGFWGGFIFCLLTGAAANILLPEFYGGNIGVYLALGAVVSVFSTLGDLFESMIKRAVGVKDSGNILPGHGGMLDRIDSLLFVFPASAVYLYFITLLSN